jgi:predicted HTH domain antitoxin
MQFLRKTTYHKEHVLHSRKQGRSLSMPELTIELPDDVFATLRRTPDELGQKARLLMAIDRYRRGLISQGRASEIAGVTRAELIDALAVFRIDVIDVDFDEIQRELGRA